MTREAPRVHGDQAVIARMERFAQQLPQDAFVALQTDTGECLRGIVSFTPTVMSFFDADGREGLNGVVRLEAFLDDGRPHQGGLRYLWLDEVVQVERLPNPSPPEATNRTRSADPNAPTVDR